MTPAPRLDKRRIQVWHSDQCGCDRVTYFDGTHWMSTFEVGAIMHGFAKHTRESLASSLNDFRYTELTTPRPQPRRDTERGR